MEKKLIDIGKLAYVEGDLACGSCILDNVCYGNKFNELSETDKSIIDDTFANCPSLAGCYKLKDDETIDENEIV